MKKAMLFLMVLVLASCNTNIQKPIEGTWKLVSNHTYHFDTLKYEFPKTYTGGQIKIFSKEYFSFSGRYKTDTIFEDSYGGGIYTLDGTKYTENLMYHTWVKYVGKKLYFNLEIKGDTLIQAGPMDSVGKIDEWHFIEKYIRLD